MGRQRLVPNSPQAMEFGNFFLEKASSRFSAHFEAIAVGQRGTVPYGTQLDVSSGTLFYFQGDADQGRRIEFEKKLS